MGKAAGNGLNNGGKKQKRLFEQKECVLFLKQPRI